MAEYILDLTNCTKKPSWWQDGMPLKIPLKDGSYHAAFDVIHEEVEGVKGKISLWNKRNRPELYAKRIIGLPIGLHNLSSIPFDCGAKFYSRERTSC